jgi:hypothetical protein
MKRNRRAVIALCLAASAAGATDNQVNPADNASSTEDNDTTQSETSHAVFGSTIVAAYNDSSQIATLGFSGFTSFMRWSYSTNGGSTWHDGGSVPAPSGQQMMGDPAVGVDASGTFYMVSLIAPSGTFNPSGVAVYRSTSTSPSVVFGTPTIVSGPLGHGDDKELIAVDDTGGTYNGRVYVAWAESPGDWFSPVTSAVVVSHLTGTSPLTFSAASTVAAASTGFNHGTNLAVGPSGEVYLAWGKFTTSSAGAITGETIVLEKSTDGGGTWVNPDSSDPAAFKTIATPVVTPNFLTSGGVSIRTRGFPYLAVDRTAAGSPTRGNVYMVWQAKTDSASTDNADIFFTSSFDGGATWTTPRTINKGPSAVIGGDPTSNDNWDPTISVSNTTGQITVTFYDRRDDPANNLRNTCSPPSGATSPCSPSGRSDQDVWTTNDSYLNGPDLAITPWGYVSGNGATWQTPDIFAVDSMGNPVNARKGIVNLLRARIRNVGLATSSGATVTFQFAPWFAGITPSAFETIGTVPQDLTPGASAVVAVNWDMTNTADTNGGAWPAPLSTFDHFCVKVTINLPSDVNQANNLAQNNFFDVGFGGFGPTAFLIGNPFERAEEAVLRLEAPKGWRAKLEGVEAFGRPFKLAGRELKVARISFVGPEQRRPPRVDQYAHVSLQVGRETVGGLSIRLAQANRVPPDVRSFEGDPGRVFRAALRVMQERPEGVSLAEEKRGLINSKQVRAEPQSLRKWVSSESVKRLGAGGRYSVSITIAPSEKQGLTDVGVSAVFVAATQAYVITGGVALPTNHALEKQILAEIARALGSTK